MMDMTTSTPYKIIELSQITDTWRFTEFEFERDACVLLAVKIPKEPNPKVLRVGERAFAALVRRCPHAGCQTDVPEPDGKMYCQCHGSEFSMLGERLSGPSALPLTGLRLELRQNAIYALSLLPTV
jgi:Rieske Fe-S protein